MGIVFRQTIKSTLLMAVGAGLGALLVVMQSRLMSQQEFGFSRFVTNQGTTAAVFFAFGIASTVSVFIHQVEHDERKRSSLLFLSIAFPIALYALLLPLFYLFRNQLALLFSNPEDAALFLRYFWTTPVYTLFFTLVIILEQLLLARHKTAINTLIKEVVLRVFNIMLVLALWLSLIQYDVFIWGWTLAIPAILILIIVFAHKTVPLNFKYHRGSFSKAEFKELFQFSYQHLFLSMAATLITYLDQVMLAPLAKNGFSALAVYTTAVFLVSLLVIVYRPLWLAAYPVLTRAYTQGHTHQYKDLFTRSSLNIQLVSTVTMVLLIVNLDSLSSLFGVKYQLAAPIAMILAIGRFADMITGMNDLMLSITKMYRYFVYFTVGILVVLGALYYFSIPRFGLYGAAWSTTFVLVLFNVIKWIILKRKFGLDPFSKNSLKIFLVGLIAFLPAWWLPHFTAAWIDMVLRSMLVLVIFAFGVYLTKPSPDVVAYWDSVRKNKRLF